MGLLSSIGGALKSGLESFETIVQHPIQSIKTIGNGAAFNELSQKTNSAPLGQQIGNILLSTGTAAAATVAVGAVAGSATATAIASRAATLVPATTKGKIAAAVIAPIAVGAIANNPIKAASAVANTATGLVNFGGNAAELAANPTLENAKTLVKENPVITALAGAGAIAAIGGGVGLAANTVATYMNSKATKENTASTLGSGDAPVATDGSQLGSLVPEKTLSTSENKPVTSETTTISSGTVRRRKRKSMRSVPVVQKVNVVVQNRNSAVGQQAKKYIKRELLYN